MFRENATIAAEPIVTAAITRKTILATSIAEIVSFRGVERPKAFGSITGRSFRDQEPEG
jgi:hypothetical protein